jgi:hypothetical protein
MRHHHNPDLGHSDAHNDYSWKKAWDCPGLVRYLEFFMSTRKIDTDSYRWLPVLGIGFGVIIFLSFVLISPLGCWLLPPSISGHVIKLFREPNSLFFKVEGNSRCIISPEGILPERFEAVRVKFDDRNAFFTSNKTIYNLGSDFTAEYDGVIGGIISVDREKMTATVKFKFDSNHEYNSVVNGEYDLTRPEPAS